MGQVTSTEPFDDFIYYYSAGNMWSGRIKKGTGRPEDKLTGEVPQEGGPWAWSQEVQDAVGVVAAAKGSADTKSFTIDRELQHVGRTWRPETVVNPDEWSKVNKEVDVDRGDPRSTYAMNTGSWGGGLYALPLDIHKSRHVFDYIHASIQFERTNNPQEGAGRNKRKSNKSRSKSKMKRIRTMKYKKRTKRKTKTKVSRRNSKSKKR
jgi:hypothetical protein